jgi:hypothetical protein
MKTTTLQIRVAGAAVALILAAACGSTVDDVSRGPSVTGSGTSTAVSSSVNVASGATTTGGGGAMTASSGVGGGPIVMSSGVGGGGPVVTSSGAGGGSSVTASGAGGNPCFPDSCNGPSSTGAGGPMPCGGLTGGTCPANYYCEFMFDDCGAFDGPGVCTPIPSACSKDYDPVCACDNKVYDNPCLAQQAGQDLSNSGTCAAPAGQFRCGARSCVQGTEYCLENRFPLPASVSCRPLPAACSDATAGCSCLGLSVDCGCSRSAAGDFSAFCTIN